MQSAGPSAAASAGTALPSAVVLDGSEWRLTRVVLGVGGFAKVWRSETADGRVAACKAVDTKDLSPRTLAQLECELSALRASQAHRHVVRFIGATKVRKWLLIFMERLSGDILADVLSQRGLEEDHARRVVAQTLSALVHLHGQNILHGDVKPENILVGRSRLDDVKLADFGSAAELDSPAGRPLPRGPGVSTGTALYSAPEVLRLEGECVGVAADMWSVGVSTYVLLSGCFPFSSASDTLYRRASFSAEPWSSRLSPAAREFISALLRHDPTRRLTAEQALHHPWLLPPVRTAPSPIADDTIFVTTPPVGPIQPGELTPTKRMGEDSLDAFDLDAPLSKRRREREPLVPL